jgi:hypothetical protein
VQKERAMQERGIKVASQGRRTSDRKAPGTSGLRKRVLFSSYPSSPQALMAREPADALCRVSQVNGPLEEQVP